MAWIPFVRPPRTRLDPAQAVLFVQSREPLPDQLCPPLSMPAGERRGLPLSSEADLWLLLMSHRVDGAGSCSYVASEKGVRNLDHQLRVDGVSRPRFCLSAGAGSRRSAQVTSRAGPARTGCRCSLEEVLSKRVHMCVLVCICVCTHARVCMHCEVCANTNMYAHKCVREHMYLCEAVHSHVPLCSTCVLVCVRTRVHTSCACKHVHTQAHTHLLVCTSIHVCAQVYMSTCGAEQLHVCMCVHALTSVRVCTCACALLRTHEQDQASGCTGRGWRRPQCQPAALPV